ncbi:MAG: hypothetical protein QOD36_202, partial [Mycobacterium sp.]|nr:hypothetical protein [Mycobacterium sp.]
MTAAITLNSSADIGMTRSRSLLEGAITSSAMISPLGSLVLPDAEVGELKRLLDSDARVTKDFHDCPLEKRGVFGGCDIDGLSGGLVEYAHIRCSAEPDPSFINPAPQTLIGAAVECDGLPVARGSGALQQPAEMLVSSLHMFHKCGQQGLTLAGAVIHALLDAPFADPEPANVRVGRWAGCHPDCPLLGFCRGPGLQVGVEGPDGSQDRLELAAALAVGPDCDLVSPLTVELATDAQVRLVGREFLDRGPEVAGQVSGEIIQRRVVQFGLAALQVGDQQLPDTGVADRV